MTDLINLPWLSRTIDIIDSTDPSLVGLTGTVLDETKRTVKLETIRGEFSESKTR